MGAHAVAGINPPLSRRQGWLVIATLAAAALTSSLQFTLMVPILPEIPEALDVQPDNAAWVIIITLLTSTVSTAIISRMADLYGRKRLLLIALGLLCLGSLIAAIGMTYVTVLIGRALQGLASGVVPIGISLIHSHVPRAQAHMGVAILSGTIGFGSALGLPLSGVLMTSTGMAGIFWCSAIASGLFVIAVWLIVPEAAERLERLLDVPSTLLLMVWLSALTLLISKSASWGYGSAPTLAMLATTLVGGTIWVLVSLRTPHAIIDLRLALSPQMSRINLASFLATFGMFANHLLTIQEARAPTQNPIGLGFPVTQAGLVLLPFALTMMAFTPLTGYVIQRFGPHRSLSIGALTMTIGFIYRVFFHGSLGEVLLATIVIGVGVAFAFASMPALVTEASPPSEHASANGVNAVIRSLSGAIASAGYAFVLVIWPWEADPLYLSPVGLTMSFTLVAVTSLAAFVVSVLPGPRDGAGRQTP